ncbi:RecX family transcriptional regulator [Methylobacterium variabile]|uniref:Regulatory protein RecX n=1 Tax=Methylobacterium variabile TaxID=298794 RepID=A0A0J6SIH8_9HYPH|nr:RecX family transcriptional regulator [Methylobacterium variabile]
MRDGDEEAGRDGGLRAARPITPAYLERAALYYLERYGASAEMLRRVLRRRVETRCRLRGEAPGDFAEMVEAVVARALGAGLVDDAAFAAAKVRSLRRRGGSARAIGAKLAAKGVDRDTVGAALAEEAGAEGSSEDQAARAYARRRRLGPFRPEAARAAARERDLAAMARAGFALSLARRVIDGDLEDDLAMP